ncbi:hypothetical protein [Alkaliphilus hydrothermalis]|uniref:Uncharacterized protein n=1 Tax=Alkaliphilus hydrothermalis TaxID=1482730 RepID=A0ABS2NPS1_9FIRM|nr:hypothetical protein [Alkaliphilus hydrothermalis]MBM7614938.1 hypothetical protein [Alkaliphilus hydrothermalis]
MKKKNKNKGTMDQNFFNEMNYELAGDIAAIDPEEMNNNKKLMTTKKGNMKTSKDNTRK